MTSKLLLSTAIACLLSTPLAAQTADVIVVASSADAGEGSLRAALETASASGVATQIVIATDEEIRIDSGLEYAGAAPLTLIGNGVTVATDANVTLLSVTKGADLSIMGVTFHGPGGFSAQNRGDLDGPAGKGIAVAVPTEATGTVTLTLTDVTVADVAGHGVHVSDCTLADECGGGSGGGGDGSAASIAIMVDNLLVQNVGHGRFDADGLRADERGDGSITFIANNSRFVGVGADGVELDEGDAGDIDTVITHTSFVDNGNYCDPAVFAAFLPAEPEGEFDDMTTAEDAIPGPVEGSPDNTCIERSVDLYDSGFVEAYEFAIDLDDGIDLDEAGDGDITSLIAYSTISGNLDEGVDWDEEGAGGIFARFIGTEAMLNTDDGYKLSEEDEGSVIGFVSEARAVANGGKGFVFEEADEGDLTVDVAGALALKNDDGDQTGIEVVQEDDGEGTLTVSGGDIADGIDSDGVTTN